MPFKIPYRNPKIVRKSEKITAKRVVLKAITLNILVFVGVHQMKFEDDENIEFLKPYVNIRSDLFIAPKYHLLACGIRKSMSQLLINIMCFLHDEKTFLDENRSMNDTWMSERVCSHTDPEFHFSSFPIKNPKKDRNLTKIAFIRDPFDRFISFYLHICQNENGCWDCRDDMRCVLKKVYKSLKKYENNPDEQSSTLVDRHAAPISWNCNFQDNLHDFHLIKIGADDYNRKSGIRELSGILAENGVGRDLIERIANESMTSETAHGTHKSSGRLKAEQQVREDPIVREYLHKIYFFDYLIFKFDKSPMDDGYY